MKSLYVTIPLLLLLATCNAASPATAVDAKRQVEIESNLYVMQFDPRNGSITRVYDKQSKIEMITEPRLADSFRLLLPLGPRRQANYILGKQQRLTSFKKTRDGVTLGWAGPLRNEQGEPFDLTVILNIRFVGQGIRFDLTARNRTKYRIREVWYPILGGITGLGARKDTWVRGAGDGDVFWNTRAPYELGTPTPEFLYQYPNGIPAPWIDIANPKINRGAYFGLHETKSRPLVFRIEMQPGIGHLRFGDTWPRPDEVNKNTPVGLTFNWSYSLDDNQPLESFHGDDVVLQFHDGDWQKSAPPYDEWLKSRGGK
jgi:hypothetical protein